MCPDASLQKLRILGIKNLQASREKKLVTFFRNVLGMSHTRGQRTLNSTLVIPREDDFLKKKVIYLAAVGFSCSMQTLSGGMWDLVPWPGIEPGAPALGVLASGPPGKS